MHTSSALLKKSTSSVSILISYLYFGSRTSPRSFSEAGFTSCESHVKRCREIRNMETLNGL